MKHKLKLAAAELKRSMIASGVMRIDGEDTFGMPGITHYANLLSGGVMVIEFYRGGAVEPFVSLTL